MKLRNTPIAGVAIALIAAAGSAAAAPGLPYTGRISFGSFYSETNGRSDIIGMSDDANYVTFVTSATNLTDEDKNTRLDTFRYDRFLGITLLASVTPGGVAGDQQSVRDPANGRMMTPDGRFVLFSSFATNLVTGDSNGQADVFIRDFDGLGKTERVSLGNGGSQISGFGSFALGMSVDAQKILFMTKASLLSQDTNGISDVYLYDRSNKSLKLVSSDLNGAAVGSGEAVIADNGIHVAFTTANRIAPTDTNDLNDVYWKDVTTGITKLVSVAPNRDNAKFPSEHPSISGDGQRVAFVSQAPYLVPGDTNNAHDVFVKDIVTNAMVRASTKSTGSQVAAPACERVSLNGNGHIASLSRRASDLVTGDTNNQMDIFIKDLDTNAITLISRIQGGALGNADSSNPVISKNGAVVGFTSAASNLFTDGNAAADVMVGVIQ
jgi:TolB protein